MTMASYVENLPLTQKEIDEAREYLYEQLLPITNPNDPTLRPAKEVFAEVYEEVFRRAYDALL